MTLTPETGAGVAGANSYVSVAEADDYFSRHLSGAAWSAKTNTEKETLLIVAARTLDYGAQWAGQVVAWNQAMQWPRYGIEIESIYVNVCYGYAFCGQSFLQRMEQYYPSDVVPPQIKAAQCELAALILAGGDRTADQDSDGIKSVGLGKGAIAVEFDKSTSKTLLGRAAGNLIAAFAVSRGSRKGMVSVVRM